MLGTIILFIIAILIFALINSIFPIIYAGLAAIIGTFIVCLIIATVVIEWIAPILDGIGGLLPWIIGIIILLAIFGGGNKSE